MTFACTIRSDFCPLGSMACNRRNTHPLSSAVLFFKIIDRKSLKDGRLMIPKKFTRKYGGNLSNPMLLKPPDGTGWKVYWTKHDGYTLFQKGWKEFATYYSLGHGHMLLFKYRETSHFEVHIFDKSTLEIEYRFYGTQGEKDNLEQIRDDSVEISGDSVKKDNLEQNGDESVEILDELPPSQKTKLKSPMSYPQLRKKLRIGTSDVGGSSNLQKLPQHVQIKGNQNQSSQGTNFEKSTFAFIENELDGGNAEPYEGQDSKHPIIIIHPDDRLMESQYAELTRPNYVHRQQPGFKEQPIEIGSDSEDSEIEHGFWKEISRSQASGTQAMHIPAHFIRQYLTAKPTSLTVVNQNLVRTECKLLWPRGKGKSCECYIGQGWYHLVKASGLACGDKVLFSPNINATVLNIKVVRREM